MVSSSMKPDSNTFNTIVLVISGIEDLEVLRELHVLETFGMLRSVRLKNAKLGNSTVTGFLTCGQAEEAFSVFRGMAAECIQESKDFVKSFLNFAPPSV